MREDAMAAGFDADPPLQIQHIHDRTNGILASIPAAKTRLSTHLGRAEELLPSRDSLETLTTGRWAAAPSPSASLRGSRSSYLRLSLFAAASTLPGSSAGSAATLARAAAALAATAAAEAAEAEAGAVAAAGAAVGLRPLRAGESGTLGGDSGAPRLP